MIAPHLPPAPPPAEMVVWRHAYEGRLLVKVLDLNTEFAVGPTRYGATARAHNSGALSFAEPYVITARAQGANRRGALVPESYIQQQGRKRRAVAFAGRPQGQADPLTQILRIAQGPARRSPCVGARDFFDGKQRYILSFIAAGGGTLSPRQSALGLTSPRRCHLSFRPLAGFKPTSGRSALTNQAYATFALGPGGVGWVMTDVSVGTILGTAHLTLTDLKIGRR